MGCDVDGARGGACVQGVACENSELSTQFCYDPETALKNSLYQKKNSQRYWVQHFNQHFKVYYMQR